MLSREARASHVSGEFVSTLTWSRYATMALKAANINAEYADPDADACSAGERGKSLKNENNAVGRVASPQTVAQTMPVPQNYARSTLLGMCCWADCQKVSPVEQYFARVFLPS
jgi:hypothetical protein